MVRILFCIRVDTRPLLHSFLITILISLLFPQFSSAQLIPGGGGDGPCNLPPEVTSRLQDFTATDTDSDYTFDLNTYFDDPNVSCFTNLEFSASSSNATIAGVSLVGTDQSVLIVDPGNVGQAQITVTARYPVNNGLSISQRFTVTVIAADAPPTVADPVENDTINKSGNFTESFNDVFTDVNNDIVTYEYTNSNPGRITGTRSGNNLTFYANPNVPEGTAEITLTAIDDDGQSVTDNFTITVENKAPVAITTQPTIALPSTFDSDEIGLSNYFNAVDGDNLSYRVVSTSKVSATVNGSTLTVSSQSNFPRGAATVVVEAEDVDQATDQATVNLSLLNQAPESTGTESYSLPSGFTSFRITGDNYFSDPEGDALTYQAASGNTGIVKVRGVDSNRKIEVSSPTSSRDGSTTITITATDPSGASESASFPVTVSNGKPSGTFPDLERTAGYQSVPVVNLNSIYSDPNGDALSYSISPNNTSDFRANLNGNELSFDELSGDSHSTPITITVSDGKSSINDVFSFIVNNARPFIRDNIANASLIPGFESSVYITDLNNYFGDGNGDALTFSARSGDNAVISAETSGNRLLLNESTAKSGNTTVTVTATDQDRNNPLSVSQTFNFSLADGSPFINSPLQDRQRNTGFSSLSIDLSGRYGDPNGDPLSYTVSDNGEGIGTKIVSNNTLVITETTEQTGVVTISLNVTDGASTTTDEFTLTLNNPAPVVASEPQIDPLPVKFGTATINLGNLFSDPNGEVVDYAVSYSDNRFAATLNYPVLTLEEIVQDEYTAEITVTGIDNLGARTDYLLSIPIENAAPVVVEPLEIADMPYGFGRKSISLKRLFFDANEDQLTLTTNQPDLVNLSINPEGDSLIMLEKGKQPGPVQVAVTATDELGQRITAQATFTLTSESPVISTPLGTKYYPVGFNEASINLNNYFTDANREPLTYSTRVNVAVIQATANGNILEITEFISSVNVVEIIVTGTDPRNNSVTDTLILNLFNQSPQLVKDLPPITLERGFNEYELRLADYFDDPNGDLLNYSATVEDKGFVSVETGFNRLFIFERVTQELGSTRILVTASDGITRVTRDINLEVIKKNRLPSPVNGENPLLLTFAIGRNFVTEPLDSLYVDPDAENGGELIFEVQEPLQYEWISYNPETRRFSGTPPAGFGSVFYENIRITDEAGGVIDTDIIFELIPARGLNLPPNAKVDPSSDTLVYMPDEDSTIIFPLNGINTTDPNTPIDSLNFTWLVNGNSVSNQLTDTLVVPPGNYNIQLIAVDEFSERDTASLQLRVEIEENTEDAPELVHPLPDLTAQVNRPFRFTLPDSTFIDIDGETPLEFFEPVESDSFPDWVQEDFFPSGLSGIPDEVDTLLIEAKARDSVGLTASDTFRIVVEPFRNNVPQWNVTELPNLTYRATDTLSFRFSDTLFYDPDNDQASMQLRAHGSSTLPDWLSYNSQQFTLNGIPSRSDTGRFRLVATILDEFGAWSRKDMLITILPAFNGPVITPYFEDTLQKDEPLELRARVIPGDTLVNEVSLMVEKAGTGVNFQQAVPMRPLTDSVYTATITPFFFSDNEDTHGYIFHVTAKDYNNVSVTALDTITYYVTEDNPLNSGIEPVKDTYSPSLADYRIISLPFEDVAVDSVLKKLGEQHNKTWRLFSYERGSFREYPAFQDFETGKGYMLIHNVKDAAIHYSGQLLEEQEITLYPGMNLIGNPYNLNLSWQAIVDVNPDKLDEENLSKFIRLWNGTYDADETQLRPLEGGYIEWREALPVTIRLPFKRPQQPLPQKRQKPIQGWNLPITLKSRSMGNATGGIGMMEKAREGRDRFDLGTLPRFMNYLELASPDQLSRSIVPLKDEYTWLFNLNSDKKERVTLSWNQKTVASLSGALYLWNETRQEVINMLEQDEYMTQPGARIKIMYSTAGSDALHSSISANQLFKVYPNPVQTQLTTVVGTQRAGKPVTLSLFNQQGKQLQNLRRVTPVKGLQKLEWNISGLEPGLYYYQISIGNTCNKQGRLIVE